MSYATSVRSALPDDTAVVWAGPADAGPTPPGVQRLARQPSLTDAMLASDLVVCGAGVTMLEVRKLGLPSSRSYSPRINVPGGIGLPRRRHRPSQGPG